MIPLCPKCGAPMTGGAPHGPWPVQYECRRCGVIVVPGPKGYAVHLPHCGEASSDGFRLACLGEVTVRFLPYAPLEGGVS